MSEEKLFDLAQRFDDLVADGGALFGAWTAFNPLSNGWAVRGPYTAAWVRAGPGNTAILSLWCTVGTSTDGTVVGTIPAADADGNALRPAQAVQIPLATDVQRLSGSNTEGAYFQINAAGSMSCYGVAGGAVQAGVSFGWYPLDGM